jgi:hypothetical protein
VRGASEEAVAGPVLPDRLKHQHVKGPDHPTPFAKGTTDHDDTAGGMYFGGAAAVSSEAEGAVEGGVEGASAEFAAGPQGWTAARINVDLHVPPELDQYASSHTAGLDSNFYDSAAPLRPLEGGTFATKRVFSETDFQLEFIAKEEFGVAARRASCSGWARRAWATTGTRTSGPVRTTTIALRKSSRTRRTVDSW